MWTWLSLHWATILVGAAVAAAFVAALLRIPRGGCGGSDCRDCAMRGRCEKKKTSGKTGT